MLTSPRFKWDEQLLADARTAPALRHGSKGLGAHLIQCAVADGCGGHAPQKPAVAIPAYSYRWVPPHELGHTLLTKDFTPRHWEHPAKLMRLSGHWFKSADLEAFSTKPRIGCTRASFGSNIRCRSTSWRLEAPFNPLRGFRDAL